jgi:hypothetical protein
VINANLIQGNMSESGSGGGIRLQQVNGTEVSTFPTQPSMWNGVSITNNIIVNNIAGWDGAGIGMEDSLNVSITNNTIASNDTLASSGVLTQSIGTPEASAPAGNCVQANLTTSCPQPAGVVSALDTPLLTSTFTSTTGAAITIKCPDGTTNGTCKTFSDPLLTNNVILQNRSFYIGIGNLGAGNLNQQKLVSLFDAFTGTAAPVQTAAGQCTTGVSYWDLGIRGDSSPSNHGNGATVKLHPKYSVLDDPTDYPGANNIGSNPALVAQYCAGSRVPPNCTVAEGCGGPSGYGVPPGIVDASSPNPVFSLTPAATVDEGNNWINVSWGPLSLSDDSLAGGTTGNYGGGPAFGNYVLAATSPAVDYVPVAQAHPTTDFFGNPRPEAPGARCFDVGAVEYQAGGGTCSSGGGGGTAAATLTPTSHNFGAVTRDCPTVPIFGTLLCLVDPAQVFTLTNTGTVPLTGISDGVIGGTNANEFSVTRLLSTCGPAGGGQLVATTTLAPGASCVITVQFKPLTAQSTGSKTATISVTDLAGTQTSTLTGTAR